MRRYWLVVAAIVGMAVGWLARGERSSTSTSAAVDIDWTRTVRVQCPDGPHPTLVLQPYSVTIDGRITHYGPPPPHMTARWLVQLDGGRVSVACGWVTEPTP
jgi:hypothetical protein